MFIKFVNMYKTTFITFLKSYDVSNFWLHLKDLSSGVVKL